MAKPSDAAALAGFQVLLARESEGLELDPRAVLRGVRAVFKDPARGTYYVAEERGRLGARLVGCLLVTTEWSDWRNGMWWWVQSVYVVPPARRRGVFRALYGHVKRLAERRRGVRGLRLYVYRRNARARKVYEALGMSGGYYRTYEWAVPRPRRRSA